jgi:hypothetical protein
MNMIRTGTSTDKLPRSCPAHGPYRAASAEFRFPIGTTFWARPRAARTFAGPQLHALERLLPLAARQAGYRYTTTYVPGMTW